MEKAMEPVMEVNNNTKGVEDQENTVSEIGKPHNLEVKEPEQWLCVAKLPVDITEDEFFDLLAEFGGVEDNFLMVSSKTGACKGYGFAKFTSSVAALQARHVLEGQEVRGHRVDCGWVKEGSHPLPELNSKVLYIDNLPSGFRDLAQFRKLFSTIVSPPYCQIAQKNGILQSWGLVEFNSWEEAEQTVDALVGANLDDTPVRIQYCIPNVHAINIYMSFVNNPLERQAERKALLDETPSKDVYQQLQALSKQNPGFVQNLQTIMTQSALDGSLFPQAEASIIPQEQQSSQQAVIALLLATQIQQSSGQAGLNSLSSLIKQLEAGTPAIELLRSALSSPLEARKPHIHIPSGVSPPMEQKSQLLPTPGGGQQDISNLISSMTAVVAGSQPVSSPSQTPNPAQNNKNPQLMNMLYSAFQARVHKQNTSPEAAAPPQTNSTETNESAQVKTSQNDINPPIISSIPPSGYTSCLTTGYPAQAAYTVSAMPLHYPGTPISTIGSHPSAIHKPNDISSILSLPPPPPPGSPYPAGHIDPNSLQHPSWHCPPPGQAFIIHPGQIHPSLWAQQPALYMPPTPQMATQPKRKVPGLPDGPDTQGFKRQKVCSSS